MSDKFSRPKQRFSNISPTTDNSPDPTTQTNTYDCRDETSPKTPTPGIDDFIKHTSGARAFLTPSGSPSPGSPSSRRQINTRNTRPVQAKNISQCPSPSPSEGPNRNKQGVPPSNHKSEGQRSGWKRLGKAMRALQISSGAIPQVQSAVGGLVSCLDQFEIARQNREEYDEVVSELSTMAEYVKRHLEDRRSQGVTKRISDIAETIQRETEDVRQIQEQSKTAQVLRASNHEEDLVRHFRRIGELFRRIQMEMSMSEWSKTDEILVHTRLEKLKPVTLAFYNSTISDAIDRRGCTSETRKETLAEINKWCDDAGAPMIYWPNGMAGTGKTTIAYTLANDLRSIGRLAASFFCTVTSEECRDASTIIPTIVYQLAHQSTPFQAALGEVLKREPGVATSTISEQVRRLLLGPLESIEGKLARNLVVVIDALDECRKDNVVGLILDSLISSYKLLPVKFFIASRPEPIIYQKLYSQPDNLRSAFHLHEISQHSVQRDIRLYLEEELKSIQPSEAEVEELVSLSGRLFIYAATAVRYIAPDNPLVDSRARLQTTLDITSKSAKKQLGIDALYSTILSAVVDNDCLEPDERDNVLSVIWAIVSSPRPVPLNGLVVIAGLSGIATALAALTSLRSVIHISHTNDTISTFHASFPQFVCDQSRSSHFFCDIEDIRHKAALRCLRVINAQISSSITADITMSPTLTYAAINFPIFLWADGSGLPVTKELLSELRKFFDERFESWLWLLTNHGGPGKRIYGEPIRILHTWSREVKAPDIKQACVNAYLFSYWTDENKQLIRGNFTGPHASISSGSIESYSERSWIWRKM